ncbi:MAG TPA: hypothetical protein PK163_11320, partial [Steroidobacteraceae bacterium]|nr:hypothetical protein [Steroidobacteraceae bacterium]
VAISAISVSVTASALTISASAAMRVRSMRVLRWLQGGPGAARDDRRISRLRAANPAALTWRAQ